MEEKEIRSSEELNNLLDFIVNDLANELPTLTIDLNYFLLGAFEQKNNILYRRLNSCLMSNTMIAIYESFSQVISSKALSAVKSNRKIVFDDKFQSILNKAKEEAINLNFDEVTSEIVFLTILGDDDEKNKIKKVFNKAGLTYGILKNKIQDETIELDPNSDAITIRDQNGTMGMITISAKTPEEAARKIKETLSNEIANAQINNTKKKKNQYINEYCSNLNKLVEEGKITPIFERDKEIEQIIRVLGRKNKNNAILVGGEGVGKTAIAENVAYRIVNNMVPQFLSKKIIVSLDMTALMAGTTLRGMFEERVKGVMDEIKENNEFILFIDNIGAVLADKGKNDYELSTMLSRGLDNGELQVFGTSDFMSYRKTFDKDPSLARRFQKIIIEAPTINQSIAILNGIKQTYEDFHSVSYQDGVIETCVKLADKYITERNLPDSAIDLLDEVGSLIGTCSEPDEIKNQRALISEMEKQVAQYKKEKNYEKADEYDRELIVSKKNYNELIENYNKNKKEHKIEITINDVLNLISVKTGIPVNNLNSDDKKKLSNMNERLKEEVIGQDNAIDTVCKSLKRNRIGLSNNGCMYSGLLIGKTGVGKTFLAKKLAKELFGNENALVRFDMSEYSDKVSVNKLIGSNPGYVGYEEGGQLTETIKNKKHCVLLFDEIEKADPEVYNIFLQVLDEGFLTDNAGQRVDFKNVIVLFTSNVGVKTANQFSTSIGFSNGDEDKDENTKRILLKELKNRFPPEFLNRINNVIYFNSLTDDDLEKIIKLELEKSKKRIENIGYCMEYDENTIKFILKEISEEKDFGARPIIRTIQENIEDKLTDKLLENDYEKGYVFKITCPELNVVTIA